MNTNPSPIKLKALTALLLLASALLSGCLESKPVKVAGGDDFPNEVEPLGKKSAAARDDSTDWNGFKTMPRTSPGMYDTSTVPDSVPDTTGSGKAPSGSAPRGSANGGRGAMAKRGATVGEDGIPPLLDPLLDSLKPMDTLITKVVDTVKGTVETVHTVVKDSILKVDSTVFVPVDSTKPDAPRGILQVSGKIVFADTNLWKTYRFRDADGDGFLAPRPGSLNLADLDISLKGAGGLVTHTVQRLAAGADLDFNKRGDNGVLASLVTVTLGLDTLHLFKLLDGDGDGLVLDLTKDANLVDLIEEHHYPAGGAILSVSIQARVVVFSKDSTRNYSVRYNKVEMRADGSKLEIFARGPAFDSTLKAGASATWIEQWTGASGDSVYTRDRVFLVTLASAPGDFQRNVLRSFESHEEYARGEFSGFVFTLRPETPVADGRWPATGAVGAILTHRTKEKSYFDGEAVAGGMEGTVRTKTGIELRIFFDRNGAATRRP